MAINDVEPRCLRRSLMVVAMTVYYPWLLGMTACAFVRDMAHGACDGFRDWKRDARDVWKFVNAAVVQVWRK
jgi:hypothetical protein